MAAVGANEWKGGFVRSTRGVETNSFMPTTMERDSYVGMMSNFLPFLCKTFKHSVTTLFRRVCYIDIKTKKEKKET